MFLPMRPTAFDDDTRTRRDNMIFFGLARLREGVSPDAARAQVAAIAARVAQEHPESRAGWTNTLVPLRKYIVSAEVRDALPQVTNTPEVRFDCDDTRKFAVIEEVAARLRADCARVTETDGVRVLTDDGWWLLRASNTQAVLVARAESATDAGLDRLKQALVHQLELSGLPPPDFSGSHAGH